MQQPELVSLASTVDYELPLAQKIRKDIVRALNDFDMIQANDRIMVCVSGGKDSTILALLFKEIQRRAEIDFEFECVCLDQKQPGFDATQFVQFYHNNGLKLTIVERDTYSVVKEKTPEGKAYCTLCSKFRRAILYDQASLLGIKKLALGHHRDDLIETLFLNMFYVGHLSSMPPKLISDEGTHTVIRPLCYVKEDDLITLMKAWNFPIIPCNLCGSQEGLKRKKMKKLIKDIEVDIPNASASLMTAMKNVKPSHLMDSSLWKFTD